MKFTVVNEPLTCKLANLQFKNYFILAGNFRPVYFLLDSRSAGKVGCLNLETKNVDVLSTDEDVVVVDVLEVSFKPRML